MMSNMTIKCEFLAGSEFKECAEDAKKKARMFDVAYVAYSFNGVSVSIGQNADIDKIVSDYHSNKKHIVSA
jgi:hypothetical protein